MPKVSPTRRRPKRDWVRFPVQGKLTLSTLADATAIKTTILDNVDDVFWYSSQLKWGLLGGTAGEGPIIVGLLDNAYSVAEIIEALDASPVGRSDRVALERSRRSVRNIGQFSGLVTDEVLNDGKPVYNKTLIRMSNASAFAAFAMNRSGSALTGGQIISFDGVLTGYWL